MKRSIISLCFLFILFSASFSQVPKRRLRPGDIYRIKTLGDANTSSDGKWVAYTISTYDSAKDKKNSNIWMVTMDGKQTVQLTNSTDNESSPRWSPDGRYVSFIAARQGSSLAQVWLLDRRGGEGIRLTDAKGDINSYSWSPDGRKLALAMKDPKDTAKNKPPQPYLINKFR